jgi:PTH1 family peptidyl-tRNA hydrolase
MYGMPKGRLFGAAGFRKRSAADLGSEYYIIGLGNPGGEYEYTRHNAGFLVIDELAERADIPVQRLRHRALVNTAAVGGRKVLLMKPVTYMNRSGESVSDAASFLKVPPERILVICDDVSLPLGKLRVRREGSDGGHKGLRSITQCLHTEGFPRLKLGVGAKPHPDYDMADWVLSKFTGEDKSVMEAAVKRAADAAACILAEGLDQAMAKFN